MTPPLNPRLVAIIAACAVTFATGCAVIPYLLIQRRDTAARTQQRAREAQNQRLLHRFDCTYGVSLREVTKFAAANYGALSDSTLELEQAQKDRRQFAAARASHRLYKQQLQAAEKFSALSAEIKPLDGGGPCPRPRR